MRKCLLGKLKDSGRFILRNYSDTVSDAKVYRDRIVFEKRPQAQYIYPTAKYGGNKIVTLILGDDKHKELGDYIEEIFKQMKAPVVFDRFYTSDHIHDDETDFCEILLGIKRTGVALKLDLENDKEARVTVKTLDLYAAVAHINSSPIKTAKNAHLDLIFILQNNFGDYSKLEYEPVKGVIETLSISTYENTKRFISFAFKHAMNRSRKKITFVHKLAEMPMRDGLFLRTAQEISFKYPEVNFEVYEVGPLCTKLVSDPNYFDVICASETYGSPLLAIGCGISGGTGLACAGNFGDNYAVYQPMVGQLSITHDEINPFGAILASIRMLNNLGHESFAKKLWTSLAETSFNKKIMTKDVGGSASAKEVVSSVIANLEKK